MTVPISWEVLVGALAVLGGQGGILYSGRRYLINGLGKDVAGIKKDLAEEIKPDLKELLKGQFEHDTQIRLIEQEIEHIKEEC